MEKGQTQTEGFDRWLHDLLSRGSAELGEVLDRIEDEVTAGRLPEDSAARLLCLIDHGDVGWGEWGGLTWERRGGARFLSEAEAREQAQAELDALNKEAR